MKFWKLTKMKNKLNSANLGWPKFFWKRRRLWLRDGLSAWDFLRDCSLERKSVLCVCTIDWEIVWWREKERERGHLTVSVRGNLGQRLSIKNDETCLFPGSRRSRSRIWCSDFFSFSLFQFNFFHQLSRAPKNIFWKIFRLLMYY